EGLRRQLQQAGMSPRDLDEGLRDLKAFDNDRVYADPRGLEHLQAVGIDKLKKFEFSLRRKAETGNDSLSLSGSDQVPDGFRQAIEEYYRSLAKKPQGQQIKNSPLPISSPCPGAGGVTSRTGFAVLMRRS